MTEFFQKLTNILVNFSKNIIAVQIIVTLFFHLQYTQHFK